ncbi:MAG: TatD family hydrolase, partial [Bacteroidales bacterium]|nr:TatD family hydrolase [Bacteroidales bacterium]
IQRAVSNNVVKLLMPNINVNSVDPMLAAENRYPGICYPMAGLHPTSVKSDFRSRLDAIESLFSDHRFIAVGEIGIDLYWDKTYLDEQIAAFREQVAFALKADLPVVIHSRESIAQIFSVLDEFEGQSLKGVFHAFSGSAVDAGKAINMGFKLGIGGVLTFKNSGLDQIVKAAGPDHIVLETDSPYLAPVPYRGRRNESSWLPLINRKLAEILGMSEEETASRTYMNSAELFGL